MNESNIKIHLKWICYFEWNNGLTGTIKYKHIIYKNIEIVFDNKLKNNVTKQEKEVIDTKQINSLKKNK